MNRYLILPLILATIASAVAQDPAPRAQERIRLPDVGQDKGQLRSDDDGIFGLQTYEIRDLLETLAPPSPDGEDLSEALRAASEERLEAAAQDLIRSLKAHLQPAWDSERNALRERNGILVALVTDSQHRWIRDYLQYVRARGIEMLKLEMRVFEIPLGKLKTLGLEAPIATLEKRADLDSLLQQVKADPSWSFLTSPSISMWSMSRGKLEVMEEVAYVKEWEVKLVVPEKQRIADPVVEVIREGIFLNILPTALPNGSNGISLDFERVTIARPIPTREIRIDTEPPREVSVASPEVTRVSLSSTFVLCEGSSVVFITPANDDQHDLLVIATVERVDLEKATKPDAEPGSDRRR